MNHVGLPGAPKANGTRARQQDMTFVRPADFKAPAWQRNLDGRISRGDASQDGSYANGTGAGAASEGFAAAAFPDANLQFRRRNHVDPFNVRTARKSGMSLYHRPKLSHISIVQLMSEDHGMRVAH